MDAMYAQHLPEASNFLFASYASVILQLLPVLVCLSFYSSVKAFFDNILQYRVACSRAHSHCTYPYEV